MQRRFNGQVSLSGRKDSLTWLTKGKLIGFIVVTVVVGVLAIRYQRISLGPYYQFF